ncbi:RNA polymerase sigma-70 factor, ECF subfamily [Sphingobacterium nematocida]|uniref:RNA polymerase sigma-70 factor, ECF subfamily n=1 Tax=Sphingobacterium nematocida TaxID=1513896 RepID=A0A1T5AUG7_9SPHI|nr:sigma-70 family RNA polymerase sigma factor [Sphingobacterium nematocida]SKB38487.1 RNA polymerase sigma-70 factor, ECF subfamily [Sphingobacterium nematocida]
MEINPDRESLLITRLKEGDKHAFEILYNLHKRRLAANLYKLLKSWTEVEEILQELFVRVWTYRTNIDVEKSFQAYLHRIASNLVHDYFRKLSSDKRLLEQVWENMSFFEHPEFIKKQVLADQELMRTIAQLPPQRRLVFKLCKLEGHSYEEVSKQLQISKAAVNAHITKANRFILENYDKNSTLILLLIASCIVSGT